MIRFTTFFILFLFLTSCSDTQKPYLPHQALLQLPVAGAKVAVYDLNNTVLYETKTSGGGRWGFPIPNTYENRVVKVMVLGGRAGGESLATPLCALTELGMLIEGSVTVDVISTLICSELLEEGVTADALATLNTKLAYEKESLEPSLYTAGISDVFIGDLSLDEWKLQDYEQDTLTNWDEILLGSGILLSDTDGDYIPDYKEFQLKRDLLNADENNNSILDGLEGDPYFTYQWYLDNESNRSIVTTTDETTVAGNDLGLLPLYHQTYGSKQGKMIVQVVDGGLDLGHEDLNISLEHSSNSVNGSNDPTPVEGVSTNPVQLFYRGHGTAVAGIIGAKGLNGKGVRGIAPDVQIAGSNWLESEEIDLLEEVWGTGEKNNEIAVSNNSWGARYIEDKSYEVLMQEASETLRNGKGMLFVFASGNDRETHSNANLSYLINNPYAITVAALNHKNKYASYSTPGSNVMLSAYGGEKYYLGPTIMTTFSPGLAMYREELVGLKGPITLDEDTNRSYTYAMNGTSAAAPMVSGTLALILDLCPQLTWRDMRWLIANHAKKVDVHDTEWIENSAGIWHNNNYGYGILDAVAFAASCQSPQFIPIPEQLVLEYNVSQEAVTIPDTNSSVDIAFEVDQNITLEWIGLTLQIDHPYAGDLDIELISPSGTVSHLMEPNYLTGNAYSDGFRFSTVSLVGEKSQGRWLVRIRDALEEDAGVITGAVAELRGFKE